MTEAWDRQMQALGAYIRQQRQSAELSLRKLAEAAEISNPYLSQLERGLHEPSVRVLHSIAEALNMSAESLLEQAGIIDDSPSRPKTAETEVAIRNDPNLTSDQKVAFLAVYRSYAAGANRAEPAANGAATNGAVAQEPEVEQT